VAQNIAIFEEVYIHPFIFATKGFVILNSFPQEEEDKQQRRIPILTKLEHGHISMELLRVTPKWGVLEVFYT